MTPEQRQEIEAHRQRICDALDAHYAGIEGEELIDARMPLTALIYVLIDLAQKAGFRIEDVAKTIGETWDFFRHQRN